MGFDVQRLGIIAGVIALGTVAAGVHATVMVEVPLERLVAESDLVVHGVVTRTGTQMVRREGQLEPHTLTEVRVFETLKGTHRPDVTVHELGGTWKQGGLQIDGTPRFHHAEEVVLFLSRHPERPGHFRTYAMAQGKFQVQHGVPGVPSVVRRDLDGVAFVDLEQGSDPQHPSAEPPRQLDGLLVMVRELVGGVR